MPKPWTARAVIIIAASTDAPPAADAQAKLCHPSQEGAAGAEAVSQPPGEKERPARASV